MRFVLLLDLTFGHKFPCYRFEIIKTYNWFMK